MNCFSRPFGVLIKNPKYQGTCEFYHIDRCIDQDCYWRKKSNYTNVSSSTYINSNTYRPLLDSFTNSTLRTDIDDYSAVQKMKQNHEKCKRRWIYLNEWRFRNSKISKHKVYSGFQVVHVYRKELKSKYPSSIIENTSDLNYIHEYARPPVRVYQGKSLIKHVYVTHRRMRTSDYELSQVKTIHLSPFDLRPNPVKVSKIIDIQRETADFYT